MGHFRPLEVVGRGSETQLQVGGDLIYNVIIHAHLLGPRGGMNDWCFGQPLQNIIKSYAELGQVSLYMHYIIYGLYINTCCYQRHTNEPFGRGAGLSVLICFVHVHACTLFSIVRH